MARYQGRNPSITALAAVFSVLSAAGCGPGLMEANYGAPDASPIGPDPTDAGTVVADAEQNPTPVLSTRSSDAGIGITSIGNLLRATDPVEADCDAAQTPSLPENDRLSNFFQGNHVGESRAHCYASVAAATLFQGAIQGDARLCELTALERSGALPKLDDGAYHDLRLVEPSPGLPIVYRVRLARTSNGEGLGARAVRVSCERRQRRAVCVSARKHQRGGRGATDRPRRGGREDLLACNHDRPSERLQTPRFQTGCDEHPAR